MATEKGKLEKRESALKVNNDAQQEPKASTNDHKLRRKNATKANVENQWWQPKKKNCNS